MLKNALTMASGMIKDINGLNTKRNSSNVKAPDLHLENNTASKVVKKRRLCGASRIFANVL